MKRFFLVVFFLSLQVAYAEVSMGQAWSGEEKTGYGVINGAVGVDQERKMITGFYQLKVLSMPGRSFNADCKIVFSGKILNGYVADIQIANASQLASKLIGGQLFFAGSIQYSSGNVLVLEQNFRIRLSEDLVGCSKEIDVSNDEIQLNINNAGLWKRVSAIRSKKAYFHSEPDGSAVTKSFLVGGDIVYVHDEVSDWYYVKFQGRKVETVGWIKKSDTIQFNR